MRKKPGTTYPEHAKPQRLEGKAVEFRVEGRQKEGSIRRS
jgi:hypothetical protein